jgi:xanthine dehydrogenase YagT iron-sulfur-binding subunit
MRDDGKRDDGARVSRRGFLKASGIPLAAPVVLGPRQVRAAGAEVAIHGPGKTRVSLTVNGKAQSVEVEPRVTLLDALRDTLHLTGAKRVCDRATCGACTVLLDGKPVYACSILAVEAHGKAVTTVESLATGEKLHPIQQAFIDHDGLQCGFCTPGFVMASAALLAKTPSPTPEEVRRGLGGNLCRCGTYVGVRAAVAQAAKAGKEVRRG